MPSRPLTLTTPYTTGPDVRALQRAVNKRRKARHLNTIAVDGEWGPVTDDTVRETAWVLGIAKKRIAGSISPDIQLVIRKPELRDATQLARAKKRLEMLASSPEAVVKAALAHVGKTESPADSNRGPGIISRCQRAMLGYDGFFWCGAFVGYFLEKTGGVPISRKRMSTPLRSWPTRRPRSTGSPAGTRRLRPAPGTSPCSTGTRPTA